MANEKTYRVKDATLQESKALPASAGDVSTDSFDLGAAAQKLARCELELSVPALGATPLPNGETVTYKLEDSADDSSFATVQDSVVVQTGAAGAGAAAVVDRIGIPSNIRQYVRVTATLSGGGADASASSMTLSLVF